MLKPRIVKGLLPSVWLAVLFALPSKAEVAAVRLSGRIVASDGVALPGHVEVISGQGHIRSRSFPADSGGRFSIEVEPGPRLLVVARAEGYVSAEREVAAAADGQEIRLDFTLLAAGTVSGRVVDESGRPVARAVVRVHYPGEVRRVVYEQESGNVRADDFGYFVLPFVAQGRAFVVEAVSEDRLPAFTAPLTMTGRVLEGVEVRLARGGQTVRVAVAGLGGVPIADAIVRLQAFADAEPYTAEERRTRTYFGATNRLARARADGWAEFRGVPAGRVTVVASRPGTRPVRQESQVVAGRVLEIALTAP